MGFALPGQQASRLVAPLVEDGDTPRVPNLFSEGVGTGRPAFVADEQHRVRERSGQVEGARGVAFQEQLDPALRAGQSLGLPGGERTPLVEPEAPRTGRQSDSSVCQRDARHCRQRPGYIQQI